MHGTFVHRVSYARGTVRTADTHPLTLAWKGRFNRTSFSQPIRRVNWPPGRNKVRLRDRGVAKEQTLHVPKHPLFRSRLGERGGTQALFLLLNDDWLQACTKLPTQTALNVHVQMPLLDVSLCAFDPPCFPNASLVSTLAARDAKDACTIDIVLASA